MDASLPIACSLTETELEEREENVLAKVGQTVQEVRELEDGYAYRFPSDDESMAQVFRLVQLERQCCAFLQFRVTVEPGHGPVWLELTGPEGTKAFLASLFS
jgi:hypothetical protein